MRVSGASRRLAAFATVAFATVAPGAGALAPAAGARTLVELSGTATPPITVFTLTPQILTLTVDVRFATDVDGELPGTVAKATIFFPHGPRVNGALFPSCDPEKLRKMRGRRSACPAGSRLGSGTASGTSPQFAGVIEHLTVDLYNGPRGRSILFYLRGENPVAISGMIDAPFVPLRGGRWGYRLTMKVPENLQQISRGIFASLLRFTTRVGATVRVHGVRHGYIEALACPPGALVPVRGVFGFRDGGSLTADSYIACGHR